MSLNATMIFDGVADYTPGTRATPMEVASVSPTSSTSGNRGLPRIEASVDGADTTPLSPRCVPLDEIGHRIRLILDQVVYGAADQPSLDTSASVCAETFGHLWNQI